MTLEEHLHGAAEAVRRAQEALESGNEIAAYKHLGTARDKINGAEYDADNVAAGARRVVDLIGERDDD